jgi:hypothetical protein
MKLEDVEKTYGPVQVIEKLDDFTKANKVFGKLPMKNEKSGWAQLEEFGIPIDAITKIKDKIEKNGARPVLAKL